LTTSVNENKSFQGNAGWYNEIEKALHIQPKIPAAAVEKAYTDSFVEKADGMKQNWKLHQELEAVGSSQQLP
jgi:hypothetical protein